MAWTYSNWITYKTSAPSTALSRLRLHIQEVSDLIGLEVSADGKSKSSSSLQQYLDRLTTYESDLASAVEGGGGIAKANFNSNVR